MDGAQIVPAGLLNERNGAVVVDEVVVDPPGPGEVRVRLRAAGLCHTDLTASRDASLFPVVLGHEGAGVIESVGIGVTHLPVGTAVVISWKVPCGRCIACLRGREPWCERPLGTAAPRVHRRCDGAEVIPFLRAGTFCEYAVVPAGAAIPLPVDLPFASAALIGCGVATGVGAALFDAHLEPGMSVAVFGLGGVGINVVQGAKLAQAGRIVAIDRIQAKLDLARRLGATDALPAGPTVEEQVLTFTEGRGVDVAFEVVGHPEVMRQAIEVTAPGGTVLLLGAAARDALLSFPPRRFMSRQQTIRGCIYGSCRPAVHFPLFARWAAEGRLALDPLVSKTIVSLDAIDEAFAEMGRGGLMRAVLEFRR